MKYMYHMVCLLIDIILVFSTQSEGSNGSNTCACGYSVDIGASSNVVQSYALFKDLLETDFTHTTQIQYPLNHCWRPQQYTVSPIAAHGPYGKSANLSNVVANPYSSWDEWEDGAGIDGKNQPGLQLWVQANPVEINMGNDSYNALTMGEIASQREDMLYGSFRVAMRVTGTPGTCGAFFWFRDDSQEIDMEFLSANITSTSKPVFLVMQTPQSVAAGDNAVGTNTYQIVDLSFDPSDGLHEYRFDWLPNKVSFYADGGRIQDLECTYPAAPGHLSLNHWSNGNSDWSQGPPAEDAVLTLAYVKAYFNSVDPEKKIRYTDPQCSDPATADICQVPNLDGPPTATDQFGTWFDRGMCGELVSATTSTTSTSVISTPTTTAASTASTTSGASTVESGFILMDKKRRNFWEELFASPLLMYAWLFI